MTALVELVLACCEDPTPGSSAGRDYCEACAQDLTPEQVRAATHDHEDFDHRGACVDCGAAFCTVRSGGSYYEQPDFCDNPASYLEEPELVCSPHWEKHKAEARWEQEQLEQEAWVVHRLVEQDGLSVERAVKVYEGWQMGTLEITHDEDVLVSAASRAVREGRLVG